jgi:DNA-binding transcriptional LysR family regulator
MFDPKLALGFVAIVEHGSITAGARAMGVAQPWMSEQLRKLEHQAGASLLLRTPRRLELTEAGKRFLPYAQKLAAANAEAQGFLASERAQANAILRIGAVHYTIGAPERTKLTETYVERHPQVTLEIHPGRSSELISAVLEGALDLAIVHRKGVDDRIDLERATIIQKYGHLYVPADHALAEPGSVPVSGIAGHELVISPGRDDPLSMRRSLAPLISAGAIPVSAPDMDRPSVQAFALRRRAVCIWWDDRRLPRTACGPQTIVPLEGYPITSPIAVIRNRGDRRRHVSWMWRLAEEMERQIENAPAG